MVGAEERAFQRRALGADVEALLQVFRLARVGVFSEWLDVSAQRHVGFADMQIHLLRHRQFKESATDVEHRIDEVPRNAVVLHIHESGVGQRPADLPGHCLLVASIEKWRYVNHRDLVKAFALCTQLVVKPGNEINGHVHTFM